MRFAMQELPQSVFPRQPKPGDVFIAKGGNGDTAFWVMASESRTGQSGHYFGINHAGEIVSTASYGHHAMRERARVGRANIHEITISIEPEGGDGGA